MRQTTKFGQWLKTHRKNLDMTQGELARKINCATDTIKKIEAGTLRPSKQLAELMASFFGVAADEQLAFVQFARSARGDPPSITQHEFDLLPSKISAFRVPAPLTPLVGRERELVAARNLLRHEATRLLTLSGPPGVGKTRLSLEIAQNLHGDFTHGAVFVPLATLTDPGMVLPAIAQALRLGEKAGQELVATVRAWLSDKRLLLVLDNFEQLMEAAPVINDLLTSAPGLKAIVSSREVLRVYGEQEFPVPPLAVPDIRHMPPLEALGFYPAVDLFVQRAREHRPDFALTNANAATVAQVCAWLDGLPLAIEMAAAQVKWIPLPRLLSDLSDRLATLTGGLHDYSPRQQTLRGAIEWSYNLLSLGERSLFMQLAVFAGSGTTAAVEAIVSQPLIGYLELLADKSLLRIESDPEGTTRFNMLDTIREYAYEKLSQSGEENATQRRHASYYLELARTAEPELNGPHQESWLNRLDADHANFRAALDWCLVNDQAIGMAVGTALWQFWISRGYLTEGRTRLEDLIARGDESIPVSQRAWAIRTAAALNLTQGYPERAKLLAARSLELFRSADDQAGVAAVLHLLGNIAMMQSDYGPATELYAQALSTYRKIGRLVSIASVLMNLGLIAKDQGDYPRALKLYAESRAVHEQMGNKAGIAASYTHSSIAAYWQGDYAQAAQLAEQALSHYRESDHRLDQAYALENLGMSHYKLGHLERASSCLQESISIFRELGDQSGLALVLVDNGTIAWALGDYPRAANLQREALRYSVQVGDKRRIAFCLEGLAMALVRQRPDHAAQLFGAAEQLREVIGAPLPPSERVDYESSLAQAHSLLGDDAFHTSHATGFTMSLQHAVEFGLGT